MSEPFLHPLSMTFNVAEYRVRYYAAKIMRLDDTKKLSRLKREYQKAVDRLLEIALADRDARLRAASPGGAEASDG